MTETLRDLLQESVADADMPDVADLAWARAGHARRRRAVTAVAGVAAAALVVSGVVWAVDQRDSGGSAEPVHSPSPTAPGPPYTAKNKADGRYQGTSVWWAPSVEQESSLPAYRPRYRNRLPSTIDLSSSGAPLVGDTVPHALAAFALLDAKGQVEVVEVLGDDGLLRKVDLAPEGSPAPVSPMHDPEGSLSVRAGASMLSPSGEYLMFPQDGSIRLLQLATHDWSTIDTGSHPTWDATWADGSDDRIVLVEPGQPYENAPVYDVTGARVGGAARATNFLNPRFDDKLYGIPRRGPVGLAQSYVAGVDVPQPPALHLSPGQSDWIGVASAPDAILVLPQETARQKQCCQAAGWLDRLTLVFESRSSDGLRLLAWRMGTGRFWQVSQVVGWTPGDETVISSYARLYPDEDCCSG